MSRPIFKDCDACDGTGVIITETDTVECTKCHGHREFYVRETTYEEDRDNIDNFDDDEYDPY